MRAFALVELGDSESIDLFLREEDARRALAECLADELDWVGLLYVKPVELDEADVSATDAGLLTRPEEPFGENRVPGERTDECARHRQFPVRRGSVPGLWGKHSVGRLVKCVVDEVGCRPAYQVPGCSDVDHVVDGDTIALRNGQHVRLVQIDTPEVYFGTECYGPQASLTIKRLLAAGSRVRLFAEPATDRVDQYGRLLRYVVRVYGALNVNIRLVAVGAAAPYFYLHRRGRYANRLELLARRARATMRTVKREWREGPTIPLAISSTG